MENSLCSSQATAFGSHPTSRANSKAGGLHSRKESDDRKNDCHCHWLILLFRKDLEIKEAKPSKDARGTWLLFFGSPSFYFLPCPNTLPPEVQKEALIYSSCSVFSRSPVIFIKDPVSIWLILRELKNSIHIIIAIKLVQIFDLYFTRKKSSIFQCSLIIKCLA